MIPSDSVKYLFVQRDLWIAKKHDRIEEAPALVNPLLRLGMFAPSE